MLGKIRDAYNAVKGTIVSEPVDSAPKAKIGNLKYEAGGLREAIQNSTADYALYTREELEEFVENASAMGAEGDTLVDLTYAKEVLAGFERTKSPIFNPSDQSYG